VPRSLATIAGDRNGEVVALNSDHVQMVKFDGREDGEYNRVAKYLSELVQSANTKVAENWKREKHHLSV
jgi:hypothetical protein